MNVYNLEFTYEIARMEHEHRLRQTAKTTLMRLANTNGYSNTRLGWLNVLRNSKAVFRLLFALGAGLLLLVGAASAMPAQAAVTQVPHLEETYVVRSGDTLSAIAQRYGVTVQALMSYNALTSTTIYVGQRLLIPGQALPNPHPVYPITYVVQRGDTLSAIARRYDTTVAALKQVNRLESDRIYVGQRLTIPVAHDPSAPQIIHVVARGDTLSKLAARYGVTVAAIKANNGLTSNTIYVGQRLRIPASLGYPNEPGNGAPVILPPTPIRFQTGATGATLTGVSLYHGSPSFSLRAFAGQTMRIALTIDNAGGYLTVIAPNGANLAASDGPIRNFEGRLPTTGNYILQVINPMNGAANFTLIIEIE